MLRRPIPSSCVPLSSLRLYSTAEPKVPIALIAQLRKQTHVSLSKARQALASSSNSIEGALEWLRKDMESSGEAKALKVGSRATAEGVVGVSLLGKGAGLETMGGVRAAMIELNCETDFVGRNEVFGKLAQDIAHTAAFISEAKQGVADVRFNALSLDELKEAPLISSTDPSAAPQGTIASAIRDTIVKVGENITLRRATAVVEDLPYSPAGRNSAIIHRIGSYVHGSQSHTPGCGQVASLALLQLSSPFGSRLLSQEEFRRDLGILERSIARQIVGMDTRSIEPIPSNEVEEQALYKQSFITMAGDLQGLPVQEALTKWGIRTGLVTDGGGGISVIDFLRWRVGEDI